ncbi:MAG: DUF5777 family beta-barrel protein [Acidobacteriota bacterium]
MHRITNRVPELALLALLLALAMPMLALPVLAQEDNPAFAPVAGILKYRCAASGCHIGPDAQRGLVLDPGQVLEHTQMVRSTSDGSWIRLVPGDPERSLLYQKLRSKNEGNYPGRRMPYAEDPLSDEEIALVRRWIESLPPAQGGAGAPTVQPATSIPRTFHDSYLVNLPTPDSLGEKKLEFRIVHRFKGPALDSGGEALYGLDTGAWISFGLAYGLTDRFEVGLRRTNLQTDYELYGKGKIVQQRQGGPLISVSFYGSGATARDELFANRSRWAAQLILARRFGETLSLMLVPTYVSRTNWMDPRDTSGTAAIGAGGEVRLTDTMAITAEWVGQIAGVKAPYEAISVGLSMATARHVFEIVATNTAGIHTDLYVPGGDLDPGDDFRIGFNISRIFSLR